MNKSLTTALAVLLFLLLGSTVPARAANQSAVNAKIDQAISLFQSGDFAGAAARFKQVLAVAPNSAIVWHFYGQSLAKTGDDMGARKAYGRSLELQPDGEIATRTQELLDKLPEPDLFAMQLDSGLTLGDWLPEARKMAAQGKRDAVLEEIDQYLDQFGPVPQLIELQDELTEQSEAEEEEKNRQAIAGIKVKDVESAKAALPKIRSLRRQIPDSLPLIQLEAKACHLMQDFACAEKAYGEWLKTASGTDLKRKGVVAALMLAKQHEALPARRTLNLQDLPIRVDADIVDAIEESEAFKNWPANVSGSLKFQISKSYKDSFSSKIVDTHYNWINSYASSFLSLPGGIKLIADETVDRHWCTGDDCKDDASNDISLYRDKYYSVMGGLFILYWESQYAHEGCPRNECKTMVPPVPQTTSAAATKGFKQTFSISGSLFPLVPGASMEMISTLTHDDDHKAHVSERVYTVIRELDAKTLHPSLEGAAYEIRVSSSADKTPQPDKYDYYLKNYDLFLSSLNGGETKNNVFFIPRQGESYKNFLNRDTEITASSLEVIH